MEFVLATSISLVLFRQSWNLEFYMDEIFHVPQTQLYCRGIFNEWNPKITTFPGSYLIPSFLNLVLGRLLNVDIVCTPSYLRFINILLSCSIPFFLFQIRKSILLLHNYSKSLSDSIWLVLFFYPFSAFYYNLYYTDTTSLVSFLCCYWLCLKYCYPLQVVSMRTQFLLLVVTSFCILTRQTNVIWIFYLLGTIMHHHIYIQGHINRHASYLTQSLQFIQGLWHYSSTFLLHLWPLLVPILIFLWFIVFINHGSIVLGDKSHHQMTIHWAMMGHLTMIVGSLFLPRYILRYLYSSFFMPRSKGGRTDNVVTWSWSRLLLCLIAGSVTSGMMCFGSLAHPFLLADNRHYMFYLWQRYLQYPSIRYSYLFPYYLVSSTICFYELSSIMSFLWLIIYLIACSLTLFPTPLLEPRYFTIPVIVALLHTKNYALRDPLSRHNPGHGKDSGSLSSCSVLLQQAESMADYLLAAGFVMINAIVMFIYLHRTFHWPDGSLARFMY